MAFGLKMSKPKRNNINNISIDLWLQFRAQKSSRPVSSRLIFLLVGFPLGLFPLSQFPLGWFVFL